MKQSIYTYLQKCPPSLELFKKLEMAGNLYLIGGVLREFRDYRQIHSLRDIDIIIDVKNPKLWNEILYTYAFKTNRFGGNKLTCHGLLVDTWLLGETWAFRNHIIDCAPKDYIKYLPLTVFLNIDSIIFDWEKEEWYDQKYCEAMRTKVLDVVLEKNPQIYLNIVRAFVLKNRYQMNISPKLSDIVVRECQKEESISVFCSRLFKEQLRRYKEPILTKEQIMSELLML